MSVKILLDANLSDRLVYRLSAAYPSTAHVKTVGLAHDADDKTIWDFARQQGFTLIATHDVDFVHLLERYGPPPKVIQLKWGNQRTAKIARYFLEHHALVEAFVENDEEELLEILSIA